MIERDKYEKKIIYCIEKICPVRKEKESRREKEKNDIEKTSIESDSGNKQI